MGAKYDWNEEEAAEAAQSGGYEGDDFDIKGVKWPLWLQVAPFYSETKENSKGTGENVSVGLRIETEGPWKGYGFFQTFVFTNPSERAQAMGRMKLGKLAGACDFPKGEDFDDFAVYAGACDAKLGIEAGKGDYPDRLVGLDYAPQGTEVDLKLCGQRALAYGTAQPEPAQEAGSHRYDVGPEPAKPAEPVTEEALGKGDPNDPIPF